MKPQSLFPLESAPLTQADNLINVPNVLSILNLFAYDLLIGLDWLDSYVYPTFDPEVKGAGIFLHMVVQWSGIVFVI